MTVLSHAPTAATTPSPASASSSRSEAAAQGRAQAARQGQGGAAPAAGPGGFAQFLLAQGLPPESAEQSPGTEPRPADATEVSDADTDTEAESASEPGRRRARTEAGHEASPDASTPPPWMAELAPSRWLARRGGAAGRSDTQELQALGRASKPGERAGTEDGAGPGAAARAADTLGAHPAAAAAAPGTDNGLSPAQATLASPADAAQAGQGAAPANPNPDPGLLAAAAPAALADAPPAPGTPGLNATDAPAATPHQAELTHAPGSAAFNDALGGQLQAWLDEGIQHAQLNLNPAELGPIDVRIALGEGGARIELAADVASTREALLQAMPELQQALGEAGVALAGAGLGQGGGQQAAPDGGRDLSHLVRQLARGPGLDGTDRAPDPAAGGGRPVAGDTRRLLDLYA